VPEGSGLLEGEGFGDFDNTGTSIIGGEVWDLGGVFAHPFLERSTELGLGPAWCNPVKMVKYIQRVIGFLPGWIAAVVTPSYLSEAPHLRASLYKPSVQTRCLRGIKIAIHVKSGLCNGVSIELVDHHVGDL